MKVRITNEAKKWLTLAEAPLARSIIDDFKNPDMYGNERAEDLLSRAAAAYLEATGQNQFSKLGYVERVLEAKAEIATNQRIHPNVFNAGRLDVYIHGTVELSRGFLIIGAYISDIWELGNSEAARNLANHVFVRRFAECK